MKKLKNSRTETPRILNPCKQPELPRMVHSQLARVRARPTGLGCLIEALDSKFLVKSEMCKKLSYRLFYRICHNRARKANEHQNGI
jgi:hypothetical protein